MILLQLQAKPIRWWATDFNLLLRWLWYNGRLNPPSCRQHIKAIGDPFDLKYACPIGANVAERLFSTKR
ncbi:MAG: hypothetical protein JWR50_973 [Mucilaginibacter sp.]|nr:hypothetical protein [Mucilaginibacter sp.]